MASDGGDVVLSCPLLPPMLEYVEALEAEVVDVAGSTRRISESIYMPHPR